MIYFTSDTHFCHENIISYCDRPFMNTLMMNENMVSNWNEKVDENDTVFHLGDLGYTADTYDFLRELNGNKILVMGNHDYSLSRKTIEEIFDKVHEDVVTLCIKDGNEGHRRHGDSAEFIKGHLINNDYIEIDMTHKPHDRRKNKFTIVGHVHDDWKFLPNQLNVSVDVWDFEPIKLNKVLDYYDENKSRREFAEDNDTYYDPWLKVEQLKNSEAK